MYKPKDLWLGLSLFAMLGLGALLIDLPIPTVIQAFTDVWTWRSQEQHQP